eukprot:g5142.t1
MATECYTIFAFSLFALPCIAFSRRKNSRRNQTLIWHASNVGDVDALATLLARAAALHGSAAAAASVEDQLGRSALYFAVRGGHEQCTRLLVEQGARVTCRALDSATDSCRALLKRLRPHGVVRQRGTGGSLVSFRSRGECAAERKAVRNAERRRHRKQQRRRAEDTAAAAAKVGGAAAGSGAEAGIGSASLASGEARPVVRREGHSSLAVVRRRLPPQEWERVFLRVEREGERLQALDLRKTCLGAGGAARFAALLERGQLGRLRSLYLFRCELTDAGAAVLARALAHPRAAPRQLSLNLCENGIGLAGADALGAALARSAVLRALDMNNNSVGDAGAVALAAGLACNRSLEQLSLWSNGIGPRGAAALVAALAARRSAHAVARCNLRAGGANSNTVPASVLEQLQRELRTAAQPRNEELHDTNSLSLLGGREDDDGDGAPADMDRLPQKSTSR